ncbi:hypothetical protein GSI_11311 [Ganoderma sinense ZZ0214-1]|uniref:Uncharacterized protein n=1 Tax=Ganoderma sinense ZZ0214-1 TaxID=1077348 RepID=A0A2G8RYQ7_9APHY|nr:hypothetical protein GSI_11311 [Ganoderma sinense ZZ0214-1]
MSDDSTFYAKNPLPPSQVTPATATEGSDPRMVQHRDAPLPLIPKDPTTSTNPAAPGVSLASLEGGMAKVSASAPPGVTSGVAVRKGTTASAATTTPPGAPLGATSGMVAQKDATTSTTTNTPPGAPPGATPGTNTRKDTAVLWGAATLMGTATGTSASMTTPRGVTSGTTAPMTTTTPPGAPPGTTSGTTVQKDTTALPGVTTLTVTATGTSASMTTPSGGTSGTTTLPGSSSNPDPVLNPLLPSPVKPVVGHKHKVKQCEEFDNKKSSKKSAGSSAPPLLLKATPKKVRVYSNGPQLPEQQAAPQQLLHPQAMPQQQLLQQQMMAPQQIFQQQPGLYPPFVHVPPPIAYSMPLQPQNTVAGYHGFPQLIPQQPAQMLNASVWDDYCEERAASRAQQFSTPRHVQARHVHYDLDEDEDEDNDDYNDSDRRYRFSSYNLSDGEESDDEEEEMEYDLEAGEGDVDIEDESQDLQEHEGGPEDEEDEDMDEQSKEDHMEDVEEDVGWGSRPRRPLPEPSGNRSTVEMEVLGDNVLGRMGGAPNSTAQHQPEIRGDGEDERGAQWKGKERATDPVTTSLMRPSRARASRSPQPDRVLPSQDRGGLFLLLLQQFSEFNETQREESRQNCQWQQNMLQYVKKLDHKVSRGTGPASHFPGHTQAHRVKAHRECPSNSMASRIVLPPQDRVISLEEQERLEAKEKAHLTDLQNIVRVHLRKLLGVTSYKEMAEHNLPLNDEEIFNYEISGPQYFNNGNFRINFFQPWKEFPFNLSVCDFFANHLLRVLQGGGYKKALVPPCYHTYDHIGEALDVHMEHARKHYRETMHLLTPTDKEKEKRKSRMVSRRGTLHKSWYRITKEVLKYDRYSELLVNLSGAHMSTDETDRDENGAKGHPITYTITRAT